MCLLLAFGMKACFNPKFAPVLFWLSGVLITLAALVLTLASPLFSYDYLVREMPVLPLVAGLVATGLVFVLLWFALTRLPAGYGEGRTFLVLLFGAGFLARLILMFSEPVLEDDYQRYLWDGAVLSSGHSPYQYSPADVLKGAVPAELIKLADEAYPVVERINHPELRTIYPIGALGFFAAAHKIAPFSLTAWRGLLLGAEVGTFLLLLALLKTMGRPAPWLALYWWNPVVLKELINSAHMETLLVPFLVLAMIAGVKGRYFAGVLALLAAASIKLWPLVLTPLMLRPLLARPLLLVSAVMIGGLLSAGIAWPYIESGLNESAGLVAYTKGWSTNSALTQILERLAAALLALTGPNAAIAPLAARGALVILFGIVAARVILLQRVEAPHMRAEEPLMRAVTQQRFLCSFFLLSLAVFLLSPAQFPWYLVWVAPLLCFYPLWGLIALVPLIFLYYAGFALLAAGDFDAYRLPLALAIWVPVWFLLIVEAWKFRRARLCGTAKQ